MKKEPLPNQVYCSHPEHNPPSNFYYEPGYRYEHTCPSCGKVSVIVVPLLFKL